MRQAFAGALLVGCVALGVVVAGQAEAPLETPPAPAGTHRAAEAGGAASVAASSGTADLGAALQRPVFSAFRRPKAPAEARAPTPIAGLPRMSAILVVGPARTAIFDGPQGKPTILAEGDRLGAFTIHKIEPQQVTVLGPEGQRVLHTSFDPSPPSPTQSPIAPSGLVTPPSGLVTPPSGTGVAR